MLIWLCRQVSVDIGFINGVILWGTRRRVLLALGYQYTMESHYPRRDSEGPSLLTKGVSYSYRGGLYLPAGIYSQF